VSGPESTNASRRAKNRDGAVVPKSDRTRLAIRAAAVEFLQVRPFREMTVAEVMAPTGLGRSAFYQYFADLHELIESLLNEVETNMHQTANPWLSGEGEPIAALRDSLRAIVKAGVEHGPIFRAIKDAAPQDNRLEQAWAAFMGRWDDAVEDRIKAQQHSGLVSKSLHARRIANALNTLDEAVVIAEFGRRPKGNPKKVLDTLHHIWVATLYGHKVDARAAGARRRRSSKS
jgi:AcrR family transcriptional regulator